MEHNTYKVEGIKAGHSTKEIANYFNFIKTSSNKNRIIDINQKYLDKLNEEGDSP